MELKNLKLVVCYETGFECMMIMNRLTFLYSLTQRKKSFLTLRIGIFMKVIPVDIHKINNPVEGTASLNQLMINIVSQK